LLDVNDMTSLDTSSVAALLGELGRSALRWDNPFRAKAYARTADRVLNCLSKDELASYRKKRPSRRRVKPVPLHRGSPGPRTFAAATEKRAALCKHRKVAVRSAI
jgi:hypothetical protein